MYENSGGAKRVRILMCGVWDLFHYGHARALEAAKKLVPDSILVVGIHSDKVTEAMKGKVVMEYEERRELLKHIKWVDEIIDNVPWIIDKSLIEKYNIDIVAGSDDVYTKDGINIYGAAKELNRFVDIPRTEEISSSLILSRIIRDYDYFINRTLLKTLPLGDLDIRGLDLTTSRLNNIVKRRWHKDVNINDPKYQDIKINGFLKIFGDSLLHTWNVLGTMKETYIRKSLPSSKDTRTKEEIKDETEQIHPILIEECLKVFPSWRQFGPSDFYVEEVSGGLTNKLYKCYIEPSKARMLPEDTPSKVLVRIYGAGTEVFFSRENENLIFQKFAEMNIGPKLYGLFEGGRIEEFMPYRTLTQADMKKLSPLIAKKLAIMHTIDMPIPKAPSLFESLHHWIKVAQSVEFDDEHKKALYDKLMVKDKFVSELNFLKTSILSLNSPVVFCHNDLLAANIMYDDETNDLCFIDYEYGSYNFRGYDIGNHFCERSINYNIEEYPHFKINPSDYPSQEEQREFLYSYLTEYYKQKGIDTEVTENDVRNLIIEANIFTLASHFLWSCWSIIQASSSDIDFGYLEFATERMADYYRRKQGIRMLFKDSNRLKKFVHT